MKPTEHHRPDRPPPMTRSFFVFMIALCGTLAGLAIGAAIEGYWSAVIMGLGTAVGGSLYIRARIREAGWP